MKYYYEFSVNEWLQFKEKIVKDTSFDSYIVFGLVSEGNHRVTR